MKDEQKHYISIKKLSHSDFISKVAKDSVLILV